MAVTYQDGVYIGQMSPDDMWRQAMAEYDAKRRSTIESSPIDLNQGVYERRPLSQEKQSEMAAFEQELFAPLQAYQEQLINNRRPLARALADRVSASRPYQFHTSPLGEVLRLNPTTGEMTSLREGRQPRPGAEEFQTITEKTPAVEATPAIEGQPGRSGIFGLFGRPEIKPVPAMVAQPERTVSRKVPIGNPFEPSQFQAPNAAPSEKTITTKAEFDALPSGTVYVRNGKRYRKP